MHKSGMRKAYWLGNRSLFMVYSLLLWVVVPVQIFNTTNAIRNSWALDTEMACSSCRVVSTPANRHALHCGPVPTCSHQIQYCWDVALYTQRCQISEKSNSLNLLPEAPPLMRPFEYNSKFLLSTWFTIPRQNSHAVILMAILKFFK